MNSTVIFELALGLVSPWYVRDIKLNLLEGEQRGQLDIYIDFVVGSKFTGPEGDECGVYDTETRQWQHLNFFEHNCFIHARVPRIKQPSGKVSTVVVPWARPGSGFTLLFEAFSMLLIEYEMPVNKVASTLRVVPNRLWRVFNYWVKDGVEKDDLTAVTQIGIDETSSRKGHNYVTVCADLEKRRVVYVTEGKDKATVAGFAKTLEQKGGSTAAISHVAIDMSPAFISGVIEQFPNAKIVFDKFHITALLGKAMDELRKGERRQWEQLKGHKYTVLYRYDKLAPARREELDFILMAYPRLGEGYRLKELFGQFWLINDEEEALAFLTYWCDVVTETDIKPFKEFVRTLKTHWTGIITYVKTKINSGIMEGINSKIQLAKRRARGYRNKENFINMIYFISGKMKFNYPHYPS